MQRLLRLLADPTRVRILAATQGEELAVNEIAELLGMSQSRISNHLRLLKDAGALRDRREGHWSFCRNRLAEAGSDGFELWRAVRNGLERDPRLQADRVRLRAVLERRRRRSREHFARGTHGADGHGARLEKDCLREEILAALSPEQLVVVDAGCGDGFLTAILAERFTKVLAFDHSPERLAAARKRVPAPHVSFDRGELDDLPLESGTCDAVFFSLVLHHVPEVGAALAEAARVLRPGGRVVIAELAPHGEESMRERMGDLRLGLEPSELERALARAGFGDIRLRPVQDRIVLRPRRHLELFLASATREGAGPRRVQKKNRKQLRPAKRAKRKSTTRRRPQESRS